jgi:hypothetical protein
MIVNQIIWLLILPLLIFVSYKIAFWAVKRFEKKAGMQEVDK